MKQIVITIYVVLFSTLAFTNIEKIAPSNAKPKKVVVVRRPALHHTSKYRRGHHQRPHIKSKKVVVVGHRKSPPRHTKIVVLH